MFGTNEKRRDLAMVVTYPLHTSPPATRGRSSQSKEREKGQENSPSPLPLLGKRMIPHGGRGHNSDQEPVGLSPERPGQSVAASPLSSLRLSVKVRKRAFDVRQRWHIADGRVPPLDIVVAHPVIHNRDQLIEASGFQEQRVPLGLESPVKGLHPLRVLVAGSGLSLAPRSAYEIRRPSFNSNCDVHS